jgi:uncharacterized protein (TIGR00375 family)
MLFIADLHLHSKYSRATSKDMELEKINEYGLVKGLDVVGTGDFSHPLWLSELKKKLQESEGGMEGIFVLKDKAKSLNFILTNEVSLVYTDTKQRKVHLLLLAPSFEVVEQINEYLGKKGRLDYDGRPIFNITCYEFIEAMQQISDAIEIIPAHAWTPHFGIFGSATGFDSIEEAFKDKAKFIHAIETGMSSDPAMNWRLSRLDNYALVSFSDSHSYWPWRLGREATAFELETLTYNKIINAIRKKTIAFTIETPPSYGKYHYDGHRLCGFSCSPQEAKRLDDTCPICKKRLTIGVLHRVEELADRPEGFRPSSARPFKTLLPLHELIALRFNTTMHSKKAWQHYNALISSFGNEFNILLHVPIQQLIKHDEKLASLISLNREGKIKVKPGYDGEYGKVILQEKQEKLL